MKLFLSGAISSGTNGDVKKIRQNRARFADIQYLIWKKHPKVIVLNPSMLPLGMEHSEYMEICKAMIRVCDFVVQLPDWEKSTGAREEREYAMSIGKECISSQEVV